MTAIALAFVAGLLSILSPCVLPLVPIVLGAAVAQHRHGPLALAAGLALSFTLIGLLVAVAGFSLGLDAGVFRAAAAVIMIALGAVLLVPAAQVRLAAAGSPLSGLADQYFGQSA
ncbi:MAG: cytochrome c biogenesis protein CcdA, partial [Pseudomonadota bacterium]